MMCHPTAGELLFVGGHRLLSRVGVRRGMRAGRHVFHLYRGVPGRGAGPCTTGSAGTPAASTPDAPRVGQLIFRFLAASKKLSNSQRVHQSKLVHAKQPDRACRTKDFMLKGPISPALGGLRHRDLALAGPSRQVLQSAPVNAADRPQALPHTESIAAEACTWTRAGKVSARQDQFCVSPKFRRVSQKHTSHGQISTGENRTYPCKAARQASGIVLVTASGNVTASHQLTPRG